MAIAVTYLEKYKPLPRNTVTVLIRHGRNCLTYAKVHTCDFDIEKNLTPGDEFYVTELDTENGKVNIGGYDLLRQRVPGKRQDSDAERWKSILVPNACPMEINRLSQLRQGRLKIWWESPQQIMLMASRLQRSFFSFRRHGLGEIRPRHS